MTFDQAFNEAAKEAKGVEVDEPALDYACLAMGELARFRRPRKRLLKFRPAAEERICLVEACRLYIGCRYVAGQPLPNPDLIVEKLKLQFSAPVFGFGPLTWLWIAVMVAQLLAALKNLLNERGETS